jgi:hypothetical protein
MRGASGEPKGEFMRKGLTALVGATVLLAAAGCTPPPGAAGPTELAVTSSTEAPVAAETNPPGDIPDSQVFVAYRDPLGQFQVDAPEGWARSATAAGVEFTDKLDGESIEVAPAGTAPTVENVRQRQAADLAASGRAVADVAVSEVTLQGGPAVLLAYTLNSEPNPVGGRQVRLEARRYLFYRAGHLATLAVWAPLGADNVDQWQRMADSFTWLP